MTREWKDETSYSQNDTRRIPTTWTHYAGNLRISVHRVHGIIDSWYLSCYQLQISQTELVAKNLKLAREEAISFVKETLESYLEALK